MKRKQQMSGRGKDRKVMCQNCGSLFVAKRRRPDGTIRAGNARKFCSRKCSFEFKKNATYPSAQKEVKK